MVPQSSMSARRIQLGGRFLIQPGPCIHLSELNTESADERRQVWVYSSESADERRLGVFVRGGAQFPISWAFRNAYWFSAAM